MVFTKIVIICHTLLLRIGRHHRTSAMTAFDNATKRNIPASSLGWIFDRIIGLQNFLCAIPRLLIDNGIMFTFVNNCSFVIYLST